MIFVLSLSIAILFGAGCFLLIKHDLVKVIGGVVLIGQATNLFIMSARLSTGDEPFLPVAPDGSLTDPLVQALTLTAIVISFGVCALLVSLVYRVYQAHRSVDIERLSDVEEDLVQSEERLEPIEAVTREELGEEDLAEVTP